MIDPDKYTADDVEAFLKREGWRHENLYSHQDLTDEEIDEELDENGSDDCWGEASWHFRNEKEVNGLKIKVVEDFGGEGMGDHMFFVVRIENPLTGVVRFFQKTGYYASYHGTNWEEGWFGEVEPRDVVKVEWFEIGSKK